MRSLSFLGLIILIGIASLGIAAAGEMCVPMGVITLEPPEGIEAKRAAVEFQHGRHFVLACGQCHHTWKGDEPVTGCMTSGCHDLKTLPRKENSKAIDKTKAHLYYKNAYHGKCIGCHKTMKQEISKMSATLADIDGKLPVTGPTGCIKCHPKE
ncbi:MAG: hypothetical protein CR984_05935 [Proteobacteria bacterium]|nr:MAG: hypothetical protein CR984_05935 [Pseudomonadota bacterium]PIE67879.1 MAG: hypothetical protein CSA23_01785 [Deltaproteobacteria bacterium]